jgi:DNA-binding transcriptional LysR family regulator
MATRPLPSLTAVKAFEAAAAERSVTRAAERLGVTPGAVSQQIRELERDLAVALFVRTPGGLLLTPAGETLYTAARDGLDLIAAGVRQVRSTQPLKPLSLGAYTHFASGWLIPRWGHFLDRHPGIAIELTTTAQVEELVPGRFDAVIGVGPAMPDTSGDPDLRVTPLLPIDLVPVCAPALAGPGFALARHRLLHSRLRPHDWRRYLEATGLAGIDATSGLMFESIGLAIDAAAEGLGVALAIRSLIDRDLALGRIVMPLDLVRRSSRAFVLTHRRAADEDPAIMALRSWLLEEIG